MKKNKTILLVAIPVLMLACTNSKDKEELDLSNAYIIQVDNSSVDKAGSVKFKTSLEAEKTVSVPPNSRAVKIPVKAAVGEYVRFSVSANGTLSFVKVYDPKGGLIASYNGTPGIDPSIPGVIVYDFIAFDPNDLQKDPLKYKTGIAKTAADKILNKPYLIDKRYFVENENITDNMGSQIPCFLNAEYYFQLQEFSVPVFNPDLLIVNVEVKKGDGGCTHAGDTYQPYPQYTMTRIDNKGSAFAFPVWDLENPNTPTGVIYSNFTLDSISATGAITFHKDVSATKKEVFVYRVK